MNGNQIKSVTRLVDDLYSLYKEFLKYCSNFYTVIFQFFYIFNVLWGPPAKKVSELLS